MSDRASGWEETPSWSVSAASELRRTPATVAPIVYPPEERVGDDFHLWDTWLLRERDGTLAPTLRVGLDGDRSRLRGTLDHGHLPLPSESLPEPAEPAARRPAYGGAPTVLGDGGGE